MKARLSYYQVQISRGIQYYIQCQPLVKQRERNQVNWEIPSTLFYLSWIFAYVEKQLH